jgi:hypothetical protein
MSQHDLPPDDPRRLLFEQADLMARSSREEQLAWLEQLRETFSGHDDPQEMIREMDEYMQQTSQLGDLRVQHAKTRETIEADLLAKLEALLALPNSYWETPDNRKLLGLAQISVAAHLYGPIRERCTEQDAQERLQFIFHHYLMR